MDHEAFDRLARLLVKAGSRRAALGALGAPGRSASRKPPKRIEARSANAANSARMPLKSLPRRRTA